MSSASMNSTTFAHSAAIFLEPRCTHLPTDLPLILCFYPWTSTSLTPSSIPLNSAPSPCCLCTAVPPPDCLTSTWGELGTKELSPKRAGAAFAPIISDVVIELGENQWNGTSLGEGGELEGCDGESWGRGCRNMSVYAFSRRSFCCKGEKKQHSSLTGKERGRATDEGVRMQFKWRKLTSEVLRLARWQCLVWVGHRWNHLSGVWSAESERRREQEGRGRGCMDPHCLRDLQAPRLCSALIIFGGEDKRKTGRSGERPRIRVSWRGPRLRRRWSGLSGLQRVREKAAERSTLDWGFLPQQRDCHKTAFQSSRGLVSLRFQVCIQSVLASLPLTDLPLPA